RGRDKIFPVVSASDVPTLGARAEPAVLGERVGSTPWWTGARLHDATGSIPTPRPAHSAKAARCVDHPKGETGAGPFERDAGRRATRGRRRGALWYACQPTG